MTPANQLLADRELMGHVTSLRADCLATVGAQLLQAFLDEHACATCQEVLDCIYDGSEAQMFDALEAFEDQYYEDHGAYGVGS